MNFKKQAQRLEQFLDDEFKKELPIALLPDGSLVYKNYRIKQSKNGLWNLSQVGGNVIATFNLKACALMGARCYSINRMSTFNEVKILDTAYQQNYVDSAIFKYRYQTVKDPERRDLALWRWEITSNRAKQMKQQISAKFKSMF